MVYAQVIQECRFHCNVVVFENQICNLPQSGLPTTPSLRESRHTFCEIAPNSSRPYYNSKVALTTAKNHRFRVSSRLLSNATVHVGGIACTALFVFSTQHSVCAFGARACGARACGGGSSFVCALRWSATLSC